MGSIFLQHYPLPSLQRTGKSRARGLESKSLFQKLKSAVCASFQRAVSRSCLFFLRCLPVFSIQQLVSDGELNWPSQPCISELRAALCSVVLQHSLGFFSRILLAFGCPNSEKSGFDFPCFSCVRWEVCSEQWEVLTYDPCRA